MTQTTRFSWLHISDLHVGSSSHADLWPNIEFRFFSDLQDLHEQTGPWDLVIFTGDAVFKGDNQEFAAFEARYQHLHDHIGSLGSDAPLVAVPGNHDLLRPSEYSGFRSLAREFPDDPDLQADMWANPVSDIRIGIDGAFENWNRWSESWQRDLPGIKTGVLPGDFSLTHEWNGLDVGIVGLNTTWLQLDDQAKNRLWVGTEQLTALCPEGGDAWAAQHHLTLLLTHHPPEWLAPQALDTFRAEIAPAGRFTVHLYGHQHEPHTLLRAEAGGQPRFEISGHSLFGLDKWGDGHKRLHGYSAGSVFVAGPQRRMRLWPREARRTDSGWRISEDTRAELVDGKYIEFELPSKASRPSSSELPSLTDGAPSMPGWLLLSADAMDEQAVTMSPTALRRFFDGGGATWSHALSDAIPRRDFIKECVKELQEHLKTSDPSGLLLLGASGEGKSLALLQIAADVVKEGSSALVWREDPTAGLSVDALFAIERGPLLLVTDDADQLVKPLAEIWRRRATRPDVSVLLAARDTDWRYSRGAELLSGAGYRVKRLHGIDLSDARKVVDAWAKADSLGKLANGLSRGAQARALVEAAQVESPLIHGSFFGGVLKTRFSRKALRAHVNSLMTRLRGVELDSGRTLREAFYTIAALDAVGLDGVDRRVLAEVLNVGQDRVVSDVVRPLEREAATTHGGLMVRTRHRSIARAALLIAEDAGADDDLGETYVRVINVAWHLRATANLGSQGWFWDLLHLGPELVAHLPREMTAERRNEIALTVARGAAAANPANLKQITTLARTWREVGRPELGIEILRESYSKHDDFEDWDESIRIFFGEWAVSAGMAGEPAVNALLASYSLSDALNPIPLTEQSVQDGLSQMGLAFIRLSTSDLLFSRGVRATSTLLALTNPRGQTKIFLKRHREHADSSGIPEVSSAAALPWLEEATSAAQAAATETVDDLEIACPMTFQALASHLNVAT